ncbi:hypothetical protein ACR9L8_02565 [Helicobacter pylori]|uniref:hypothetical protein n=1 Tax=Helicobacter pylori TaxID=210 RepID=UPI0002FFB2DD|nr:hypothetical protein [Helicobacter pylori]WQV22974.1 hypothetical protein KVL65_03135 [Helicobacter pylori]WQV31985.1 hypothetical protein KVK17_03175 [Helicobacter pylori]WQV60767.1 hypothetical protein KVJ82_03110 [Helicobacter pylori]WQV67975.1 hypothetical protein KVJ94_03110 [Helicobacter pylori]WQV94078.1 hypothetical protein KVK02_03110 [Helicobacter pylori]
MAIRFGVIFIDNNIDSFFNDRRKTELIRSILERKIGLDFIRFIEATAFIRIEREITSFLVFQDDRSVTLNNDPSATFNLKNYLLVLAKKFYCSVCYCENINTQKIEWISTNHSDFGEILHEFSDITSYELPQFLTDLKDKIIEFNFHKKIINNSLPFGIIFIVSDPENLIDINDKNKKLESCFHYYENSHLLYFPIITESYLILDNLKSYFIFQNENEKPFNLKQHLLELKKELGFEPSGIFYCENASTHKIELISNEPKDFKGVLLESLQITSLSPNELPQFLANFKFSKSTYGIDKAEFSLSSLSLENMTLIDNLSTLKRNIKNTFDRYSWHGYSKIPQEKRITQIKKQVSEECKVNPFFHSWRVSSEQNRKVNKIAEDLKNGKIVGEKIIDNVFDINASYCFITPEDLKNLKERLFIQQDIDITHVINQKKGEAFDHILINDIKYNLLDNTFHFIFNVDNSSQLTIKVPRKDLENYELPNTKKDIFNNLINIRRIDENLILKNNEEITNDLNPLLEQLKTQEFPLSDAITKAINQKEKGIALDYALINDIKYNLLDNTFHFIFNVDNSLLKESSQLIIEVPREALDLENVDRLIENTLSSHRVCFCSEIHSVCSENSLICHLNQGSYIIDLHLIDD